MQDLTSLKQNLQHHSWFKDLSTDKHNKIVVFVDQMSTEINSIIPETFNDTQVLVHFTQQPKEKYCNIFNSVNELKDIQPIKLKKIVSISPEDISEPEVFLDINFLKIELAGLISKYNTNIVTNIFYEFHDLENAVTDLSSLYPDVRATIDELYNTYGFDIIYEILNQ